MRSRTFLHVSLGILALAAAYHFGARTASAQMGLYRMLGTGAAGTYVQAGGSVYLLDKFGIFGSPGWHDVSGVVPVPAGSILSLTGCTAGGAGSGKLDGFLVSDSGSGYYTDGISWTHLGVLPGATPTRQESFGAVKARYR
jgi:hypothetical protein